LSSRDDAPRSSQKGLTEDECDTSYVFVHLLVPGEAVGLLRAFGGVFEFTGNVFHRTGAICEQAVRARGEPSHPPSDDDACTRLGKEFDNERRRSRRRWRRVGMASSHHKSTPLSTREMTHDATQRHRSRPET
jgi:hypothetical protein